jgi:hypothetical protein
MLTTRQKQLILAILQKENKRLFSRYKGKLLEQTISDLGQMLRNERLNSDNRGFANNVIHLMDRKKQ